MNSIKYDIKKYKFPYSTTKSFYYEFVQSFPSIGTLPYFFHSLSLFRDEMLNGYIWLLQTDYSSSFLYMLFSITYITGMNGEFVFMSITFSIKILCVGCDAYSTNVLYCTPTTFFPANLLKQFYAFQVMFSFFANILVKIL